MPPHLADWLKWGLKNLLPGLALNLNPPDVHLESQV
jgi:hypothetical protein